MIDLSKETFKEHFDRLTAHIQERGDLPHISTKEQLDLLEALADFELGRFLIQHKELDGYWTDYVLMHPQKGRIKEKTALGEPFSQLEDFILNKAPTALATQERFDLFQKELQPLCREGVMLASVPCGLMSDLLSLDFSSCKEYHLFGVDIDKQSIALVEKKIAGTHFQNRVSLLEGDAWHFRLPERVDVITSNGLNIYEYQDERVVELYRQFYHNLKPGGTLVTSFLTPPPTVAPHSEWKLSLLDARDMTLQKVLFADVLGARWQAYRSSKETEEQLVQAGFNDIRFIPDRAGIFPTVVARRPES